MSRYHALAAAVGLALLTTGCTSSSDGPSWAADPSSTAGPAAKPLVTEAEANKIVDGYQSVNNDANASLSAAKMANAEGGALLVSDRGYLTETKAMDQKEVKENLAPFAYVNRAFFIPPVSANADWFVLKAQGANLENGKPGTPWKQNVRLVVFKKTAAGWRAVLSGGFSGDEVSKMPQIAVGQGGLAEVVDPRAKIGDTAPADLAGLVADLYVNGGRYSPLAETAARSKAAGSKSTREDNLGDYAHADFAKAAPRDGTTYAMRTADGGALVLGDGAVDETLLAKDVNSYITLGKVLRPFVKNGAARMDEVVIHDILMETAVIAAGGAPAVYGISRQTTSIDATPASKI